MTPAGFSVMYAYGSARYNSAGQFVALLYAKLFGAPGQRCGERDPAVGQAADRLHPRRQPARQVNVMGYTNNYCNQPTTPRATPRSGASQAKPVENRHIIWGRADQRPDGKRGHIDNRADFGSNEVTIDYNTVAHRGARGPV